MIKSTLSKTSFKKYSRHLFSGILIILIHPISSAALQIQHFEPSIWWVGMKNPVVQILVHGKNIGNSNVSVKYHGIKILKINKVENQNYLFLDLNISPTTKPGKVEFVFSEKSGEKVVQQFELRARKLYSAMRKSVDASDLIYLITPDRFVNGNPDNDNQPQYEDTLNRKYEFGRHGGDITGIRSSLDYISTMGYTTIWPMPLEENKMENHSYHGYAITDFYKIDPRYGNNDEYLALSKDAHRKGLKLIRDVILNHCGIGHWWMNDMPDKTWINYGGKFSPTNHAHETQYDPHASQFDKEEMIRGWFVPSMPDMNQRNNFMVKYLIQNTIWWVEYADLDGLRIDTYPYSEKKFLAQWSKAVMDEYPNLMMVGEEWNINPINCSYWQKNKKNTDNYQSQLPSLMDFPMQNALVETLIEDERQSNGWTKLYQRLASDVLYPKPENLVTFGDNHDMSRFFTQVKENMEWFKLGMVFLMTTRGIPQIYYGTEIGMSNPKSESHGEIRSDFPGGWPGDSVNVFKNKGLSAKQNELLAFCKTLFNWRKTASAIHKGRLTHFNPVDGLYAYFRYDEKEKYLILLNKKNTEVAINVQRYSELLPENVKFMDVFEQKHYSTPPIVPAKGFRILKIE